MIDLEPKQLRERAARIMDIAQRADDYSMYIYEKNKADNLLKIAEELEKQNNDTKN